MVKEAQEELAVKACVWCDVHDKPYYPENIVMALDNLGLLAEGNLTQRAADLLPRCANCGEEKKLVVCQPCLNELVASR
jgi:hypothetical protein